VVVGVGVGVGRGRVSSVGGGDGCCR
jgi:hypothetical protein